MFFDTLAARRSEKVELPKAESIAFFRTAEKVAGYWEEHCVECGAPKCYARCEKYERTLDGKCRRFENGIVPVKLSDGAYAYLLSFKEWGKLEFISQGTGLSRGAERFLRLLDGLFVPLARILSRCCPKVVPWNRNPAALYRAVRKRLLSRQARIPVAPNYWVWECWAEKAETLTCSIMTDNAEIYSQRVELAPGWNHRVLSIPPTRGVAYFRIFPIGGGTGKIIFRRLDIARGEPLANASATHQKDRGVADPQPAQFVKCLVWDLDNTLWHGILAEDGPETLQLRSEAVELIKTLDARGILHSVASKNDYETVRPVLDRFGLSEYFIYPQINWFPKSENIRQIAKDINIGLNTLAFVDDSSYERGEVADKLPMVRVYADTELRRLAEEPCFSPPVSFESAKRRFSYLAEMERRKSEHGYHGSPGGFLRDCDIRLTCGPLSTDTLRRRCWELVQRTNQLTLAARRYTEDAFSQLLADTAEAYAIHCKDRFGDYGIVGFVAVEQSGTKAFVREFVMSCRVAKKLCEQSVLLALADRLRQRSATVLEAEVVQTGRNKALVEAFDAMPFSKEAVDEHRLLYRLSTDALAAGQADIFVNPVTFGPIVQE